MDKILSVFLPESLAQNRVVSKAYQKLKGKWVALKTCIL